MNASSQISAALFYHLALPAKLPHCQDPAVTELENALLHRLLAAVRVMRDLPNNDHYAIWESVRLALVSCKATKSRGRIERTALVKELKAMSSTDFFILHVESQNAGILIHRAGGPDHRDCVIIEVFEASPQNKHVLAAHNALQWDFPGGAVALPLATFRNEDFLLSLASFLEQASLESTKAFAAHAFKAGETLYEDRDTPDPTLISSMLMAILEANGQRISTPLLRKRVRDDVCWESAPRPWRRLPYWLVLRVGVERYLSMRLGGDEGRIEYKFFLCLVFAAYFDSCTPDCLSVEQLDFLKVKLCRRLAKLDVEMTGIQAHALASRMRYLFANLTPRFNRFINQASKHVQEAWDSFKKGSRKQIPPLPRKANPKDLVLSLPNSSVTLAQIYATSRPPLSRPPNTWPNRPHTKKTRKRYLSFFAKPFYQIAQREQELELQCRSTHSAGTFMATCTEVSMQIVEYINKSLPLYNENVEPKSILILTVMELWVKLDETACAYYPLLQRYHPCFYPAMLDMLHLQSYHDMCRLSSIQNYLHRRINRCGGTQATVFDDLSNRCFAVRYFNESSESDGYSKLLRDIEEKAEGIRREKLKEFEKKRAEFENLTRRIDQSACIYVVDDADQSGTGRKHDDNCPRCKMKRRVSSICIKIYEHPLPSDLAFIKAVIFELACPAQFAAYRDATWYVLWRLGSPTQQGGMNPKCLLRDYLQLKPFVQNVSTHVILASTTKSFLTTHYANMQFPVEWEGGREGVCRPNGLKLAYFDVRTRTWPGRVWQHQRLTFEHHLRLEIPKGSPFANLLDGGKQATCGRGPSSYEIMASQSTCPPGLSPHECLAFQALAAGKSCRWLTILTELGSSNLNFSNEATLVLISHLALEAGPAAADGNCLRQVHLTFRDAAFVRQLLDQLSSRLAGLATNWRERYQMDIVITLALRIYELAGASGLGVLSTEAVRLLESAREICRAWFWLLRTETYYSQDAATARRCQEYGLWAALLCKRTFWPFLAKSVPMDSTALQVYIECSIALYENLAGNVTTIPKIVQQAVIRDVKMTFLLQKLVYESLAEHTQSLRATIKKVWPGSEGGGRTISVTEVDSSGWAMCTISSSGDEVEQSVDYNYLEGILLVDGKPIGKLPENEKNSTILQELFGSQTLMTVASPVPGMTYALCIRLGDFDIHIGYERGEMVILAKKKNQRMRLIPRALFRTHSPWDLPGPLLDAHFHWMDLDTGKVYITEASEKLRLTPATWILDFKRQTCRRQRGIFRKPEHLVDTCSTLFGSFIRVFDGFEDRAQLLVSQPAEVNLNVEIRRLQLSFHVWRQGCLYSQQLRLEIDPNQDAGTWYGLASKLVCRRHDDHRQRTILVPIGEISVEKLGCHVTVRKAQSGVYGKFTINNTLGRIDCAAEPVLIYTKAELHAYTSFILPDPLTGRTGTEESIGWLQSAICQPWTPISPAADLILHSIAKLTPRREYYPAGLRSMKTDYWKEAMTSFMQHPSFRGLIRNIIAASDVLATFSTVGSTYASLIEAEGDAHLNERATVRRLLYERCITPRSNSCKHDVPVYTSRDRSTLSNRLYSNVLGITNLIKIRPASFKTPENLARALAKGNIVGGFDTIYDTVALSDRLRTDIRESWGSLVTYVRNCEDQYSLMFLFAPLAFKLHLEDDLIKSLAAFAVFSDLLSLPLPPPWEKYVDFRPDCPPELDGLVNIIEEWKLPPPSDLRQMNTFASAKQRRKLRGELTAYVRQADKDCRFLAQFILDQWPCLEPKLPLPTNDLLVDAQSAMARVLPEWQRLYQNFELSKYLAQVQKVLNDRQSDTDYAVPALVTLGETYGTRMRGSEVPTLDADLVTRSFTMPILDQGFVPMARFGPESSSNEGTMICEIQNPLWKPFDGEPAVINPQDYEKLERPPMWHPNNVLDDAAIAKASIDELKCIIGAFSGSNSRVRQRYARDLQQSLQAFERRKAPVRLYQSFLQPQDTLASRLGICQAFSRISSAFQGASPGASGQYVQWLQSARLWPAVTTVTLLEQLRSRSDVKFGSGMREALIQFALAITKYQREMRLNDCVRMGETGRHRDEQQNPGHQNWNPAERPDWLLLEIESNLLIRPDQVDVALATIDPGSGTNSVLQMNMGQGKTSCIIPMVSVALANGKNLTRVVVPKALLSQTAQLLHSRLGGFLNRNIYHVPFSRRTPTNERVICNYREIHERARGEGGIMICQPEHNLSFMLSGLQRLLDRNIAEAAPMITTQNWLKSVCRDILDESDYTLAVRTQLIYPSGSQMTVDGHPHRWLAVETLLTFVDMHLYSLSHSFPHSIEVIRRAGGGFPLVYFLRPDVEDELLRLLTTDILKGRGNVLPMASLDIHARAAIKEFLTQANATQKTLQAIQGLCPDRPGVRKTVYLLRGLLVNRILMMTLKKRWNVQYGLNPNRDPIAVPFHAKGVPSDQSEWGHPDVAILFTCLAFYYDGVNIAQLRQSLDHILQSDDPSTEYDKWSLASDHFPESLRSWNSINVDDGVQVQELWSTVRYSVVVVNHYLNNFVFPRHAKQFKVKLQSNGWDIPVFLAAGGDNTSRTLRPLTTGFSGTNDNRTMLPLNIKQDDLPALAHTNAEVLTYLLHPRCRGCIITTVASGRRASELELLGMLKYQRIRILIDAGAQILEMDNETLVKTWLEVDPSCEAALYFDSANKPWIISKYGRRTPLLASPYADDLSKCLVYLDEAHTRGTDLKFPPWAHGALTLGLGQTKDHTVQAAMRLRQLGTTQSVTFFVPPEVHQSIADLRCKTMQEDIDSYDVICWLLDNTCDSIEQLQPLYYSQGIDFCRRTQAAVDNPDFLNEEDQRNSYVSCIKKNELQSLQNLYEPKLKSKMTDVHVTDAGLRAFVKELKAQRKAFQDTGRAVHGSALEEVEQEREVAFEVESVRQLKKPNRAAHHKFPGLHKDLEIFVRTGRLPADSHAIVNCLGFLSKTGVGIKFHLSASRETYSKLFVSYEFERTVKLGADLTSDNFLRPVNWVLWSMVSETALVVIPEEAEQILAIIRDVGAAPPTHLILYAAPITRKMLHFNDLTYLGIPTLPEDWKAPQWLKTELGILAGRLYFNWEEYSTIHDFLGVSEAFVSETDVEEEFEEGEGVVESRRTLTKTFTKRPLAFLQEWLTARRCGQDFVYTPMGYLVQSKRLQLDHPFFRKTEDLPDLSSLAPIIRERNGDDVEEEGDSNDILNIDDREPTPGDGTGEAESEFL